MTLKIGMLAETAPGERRVALDPPTAARLVADGLPDDSWGDCTIVEDASELAGQCQILLSVRRPESGLLEKLDKVDALAIDANDVVNQAAYKDPSSPIYGDAQKLGQALIGGVKSLS